MLFALKHAILRIDLNGVLDKRFFFLSLNALQEHRL